ncbi:MAG TPA: PBSX family phage terminase large subunit [Bacteroidales bacterium]|nr:PBSX family phage terminase large subunit [Petrotogaceae bacterium]HQJ20875.1 PBSX family phage terminase large subunit [Bacteroidales bacterium]
MKIKIPLFKWKPRSKKQEKILTWWMPGSPTENCDAIIADGAVRSGKTLPMSLSFPAWAMENFEDQNFIMSGKTVGSFRRNVLTLQKRVLNGRGYQTEEKRSENLLIVYRDGKVNYFYIFGGKDEGSQDLIQGITAAGALFDEVALMPESFVNQAVARCSVDGSRLWFNCNPEGPNHYFKKKWIDQARAKNAIHLHFTMEDNLSLSDSIRERYKRLYSGLFYDRFILGLWKLAQGIIYDCFDPKKHIVKALPEGIYHYYDGSDYGTAAPTGFLKIAHNIRTNKLYAIKEYFYDSKVTGRQKTNSEFSKDYKFFTKDKYAQAVYIDPSAASFKTQLKCDGIHNVKDADNSVLDGIRTVASAFSQGILYLLEGACPQLESDLASYVWDEKAQQYGEDKPIKQNDHMADTLRYIIFTKFFRLINRLSKPINDKPKG